MSLSLCHGTFISNRISKHCPPEVEKEGPPSSGAGRYGSGVRRAKEFRSVGQMLCGEASTGDFLRGG